MFININNLSKSFKLFHRKAGLKGAVQSFFNRKYEVFKALDNINLDITEGEVIGILGENGAGKTTFFYIIAGILNSDSGKVFINEKEITNQKVSQRALRGIAYLPQEPSIFRRLTVKENLMAALEQRNDLQSPERIKELDDGSRTRFLKSNNENID